MNYNNFKIVRWWKGGHWLWLKNHGWVTYEEYLKELFEGFDDVIVIDEEFYDY